MKSLFEAVFLIMLDFNLWNWQTLVFGTLHQTINGVQHLLQNHLRNYSLFFSFFFNILHYCKISADLHSIVKRIFYISFCAFDEAFCQDLKIEKFEEWRRKVVKINLKTKQKKERNPNTKRHFPSTPFSHSIIFTSKMIKPLLYPQES